MVRLDPVDGESFFKNMLLEIMNNDDIVSNHYNLTRNGNRISFNGNCYCFFEVTEAIDDSQLKMYYDQLSTTFNKDFKEFIIFGEPTAELLVRVNDKIIHVNSDNMCDDWIFEKIYGKSENSAKTK